MLKAQNSKVLLLCTCAPRRAARAVSAAAESASADSSFLMSDSTNLQRQVTFGAQDGRRSENSRREIDSSSLNSDNRRFQLIERIGNSNALDLFKATVSSWMATDNFPTLYLGSTKRVHLLGNQCLRIIFRFERPRYCFRARQMALATVCLYP